MSVLKQIQEQGFTLTPKQVTAIAEHIIRKIDANGNKSLTKTQLKNAVSEGLKDGKVATTDDIEKLSKKISDEADEIKKKIEEVKKKHNDIEPAPIVIQGSQLYRDINTDNDYGKSSNLSAQEMVDYYGKNSELTDYAILQKYKEFGQIDLKNEQEKLQEWDKIMHEAQNKASAISDYVDNNGTNFGGYMFNLFGGDKFLTNDDLLAQGLSGKDIETIKKYDSIDNGGDNDGKISKKEAINAGVLGNATFKQHELDNPTQRLFNNLGGEDNIVTEEELNILKELGYDPSEIYNKYKITIGNKTGIAKGDFGRAADEIDLNKINDKINKLPTNIKRDFIKTVDTDGDNKISSKEELAMALENFDSFKDKLQNDVIYSHDFIAENSSTGQLTNLLRVYQKDLQHGINYKYSEDDRQFITTDDKFDKNSITYPDKEIEDILVNGRKFIDIGKFTTNNGITLDCVTVLDDAMKDAIAKTYHKESSQLNEEDIKNFEEKWQCKNQYDAYNLGALKHNIINTHALFEEEDIVTTDKLNEKTIAGYDPTGKIAKLLDYADGEQDGYVNKDTFVSSLTIDGHKLTLDQNKSGDVSKDELDAFTNKMEDILGEDKVNEICNNNNNTNNYQDIYNKNINSEQPDNDLDNTKTSEQDYKHINNEDTSNGLPAQEQDTPDMPT